MAGVEINNKEGEQATTTNEELKEENKMEIDSK